MPTEEKKLEIAERLILSNTFKKAPTSMALLRYLVEANIDDRFLKEGIIDIEFFGTEVDSDKNNPKVRVNIYNLRKKLDTYYKKEGANDKWQICIDKGQYSIRFERRKSELAQLSTDKVKYLIPYLLLFVSTVIIILHYIPKRKPSIWEPILNNGRETNLFIGDAFGFRGRTVNGSQGWTRDFTINSIEEYYAMIEEQPDLKESTYPTNFFYSTRMAENATYDLSKFFSQWDKDFNIRYATNASFDELTEENTIYVGRITNQSKFIYLFNESNPYVKIDESKILLKGHESLHDTTIVYQSSGLESDLAIVSRVTASDNTEQFFFFSNHDIGVMATAEYFTNQDSINAFCERHIKNKRHFTAVFRAKGKDRIDLKLEKIFVAPF
ncbi:MAG: winged helix-turn-helix domain-containing protein [Reichenbachiella sp.]